MKMLAGTIILLAAVTTLAADASTEPDPLFRTDDPLTVEITAPVSTLIRQRPEEEYLEGVFSFREPDGARRDLDIRVRARGKFRHRNCDFPPLTLNFNRSQVEGTLFDQQNKLKMVVHCKDSGRYMQAVIREYLAYRILNILTDASFRARLLQVTWVDSDERRGRMARHAFLIEHKSRLGQRLGREEVDIVRTEVGSIQPDHLNLTSLFQFLIGNTDFSPIIGSKTECCHNYMLFGKGDDPMLAIPYDFDYSGLVNAPYAMPEHGLGIENVRQRAYLGFCVNNGFVADSVSRLQASRDNLYALVADQPGLEPRERASITAYLDEFYAVVDDAGAVERQIIQKCQ